MPEGLIISSKGRRAVVVAVEPGTGRISEDGREVTFAVEAVTFHGYSKSHERKVRQGWEKAREEGE